MISIPLSAGSEYKVGGEKSGFESAAVEDTSAASSDADASCWACFCFCNASRAASWRRARDGGMLSGGGGGGRAGVEEGLLDEEALAPLKLSRAKSEDER